MDRGPATCEVAGPHSPSVAYKFSTQPLPHQLTEFELAKDLPFRAEWWETGCAKSKPAIDQAGYLFDKGEVDALLVMSTAGVARNWVSDEIPAHLSPGVDRQYFVWNTDKCRQVGYQKRWKAFVEPTPGVLKVLAFNFDSVMVDFAGKELRKFMLKYRCLYVIDEGHNIANAGTNRTIRILASGKYAPYRRLLTGTPATEKPFQVDTQARFLKPDAFHHLGIQNHAGIKAYFGVWEKKVSHQGGRARSYDKIVSYRNLEQLREVVLSLGSRLLKKDVLNLPAKMHSKHYFELAPAQRRMYDQLRDEYMTHFEDGAEVTADLPITRQLRLQQIAAGYLPADDEKDLRPICPENPRMKALLEVLEPVECQSIIWGEWNVDIDGIAAALKAEGKTFVTYDGRVSQDQREQNKFAFQRGDVQYFVAKPSVGGEGLTLNQAKFVVYYTLGFSLKNRIQTEDRCHRVGQTNPVKYVDIVAINTVNAHVLSCLRSKREVSAEVMGDKIEEWI